jgi:MFS family permease
MRVRLDALQERPFRLLFLGQAVSLLGDGMVGVALAFAVLEETGSASDLGIVPAARTIPLVAFLHVGGVWADRLPRRALMVTTDLVRLAAHGAMAALLIAGDPGVWPIAALAAIAGAASAFFNPAISGIIPAVVSAERLQQAREHPRAARRARGAGAARVSRVVGGAPMSRAVSRGRATRARGGEGARGAQRSRARPGRRRRRPS